MKKKKPKPNKTSNIITPISRSVEVAAALIVVISFILSFFRKEETSAFWYLLVIFVFFLLAIYLKFYRTLNKYLNTKYPYGYTTISSIVYFSTRNGTNYEYESIKHIQNKTVFRKRFDFQFHWTGDRIEKINSDFAEVGDFEKGGNGEFDQVPLLFKRPLLYNEVGVVQVEMDLVDSKQVSSPHLDSRIDSPTALLRWRAELRHLPAEYNKVAVIKRCKIDAKTPDAYEEIDNLDFDNIKKCFEYVVIEPEVGYRYRLEWEMA